MIHDAYITADGITFSDEKRVHAYYTAKYGVGCCLDVEIREHREKRSDRQNRAMWALLHEWCQQAKQGWRPDDLKDAVLGEVFGTITLTQPLTGVQIVRPAKDRSSQLNVSEFVQVIDAILELAATTEPPVFLLAPDEYTKAKEQALKAAARHGSQAA
jgi:hypothetical protein